jgi:hypothetical protein
MGLAALIAMSGILVPRLQPDITAAVDHRGGASTPGDSHFPSTGALDSAIARDPFRSDRRAPAEPYRIGGGGRGTGARRELKPVPPFRLLGTVAGAGAFAIISLPGLPPQNLSVGQEVEGFRLTRVEPGAATLMRADTSVTLRLEAPGERGRIP